MNRRVRWLRALLPDERMRRDDVFAGLAGAIGSIPDGMAAGVLAGVSPVHGLYASVAGRIAGGYTTGTRRMVVTATSASALAAGSALVAVPEENRPGGLALLTLLAGLFMILAAVLRLGRYTRFVSHSVMTGFLAGIAANIAFGQLADLTGSDADADIAAVRAIQVLLHPGRIDPPSLITGLTAIALMLGLARTRLRMAAALAALAVPTALVVVFGWDSVARVSASGEIPSGLPGLGLPDLTLLGPGLISGALAVAVIVLVQGTGVAEAAPNPDGTRADVNRDFTAQGVGNIAAALVRGMPVGGSMGQTALNQVAGARTRWGGIWSGLWGLAILAAFAPAVGKVPMPTLAAVLIVAAVGSISQARITAIWSSGSTSRIALVTTFVATLVLPVAAAVGVGVALSLLLQLNREAMDLKVVRLRAEGHRLREVPVPASISDREIVILDVYGSLFYAGARTLQAQLPDPAGAEAPVVILRLRGRTTVSATFFVVVAAYARRLAEHDGRLYLSGVDPRVRRFWTDDLLAAQGVRLEFFPATATIGESTLAAYAQARLWLRDQDGPANPE
ncbi:SulP family inorganic anion transporter [Nocardia sp. NPDC003345]